MTRESSAICTASRAVMATGFLPALRSLVGFGLSQALLGLLEGLRGEAVCAHGARDLTALRAS